MRKARRVPRRRAAVADAAARGGAARRAAPETPPKPVRIDFDKLQQRIVALPFPRAPTSGSKPGVAGMLFVLEPGAGGGGGRGGRRRRRDADALRPEDAQERETRRRRGVRSTSPPTATRCCCAWAAPAARGAGRRRGPAGSAVRHRALGHSREAGRGRAEAGQYRSQRGPHRRVEADVPRGLAHRAQLLLRSESARREHGRCGEGVREVSRFALLARRPELHLPRHAERDDQRATCAAAAATSRWPRPSPAACWARTTRSPTAATASRRSTPARAGIRNCRRRWRSPG